MLSPLRLGRAVAACRGQVFWSPGFFPPFPSSIPTIVTVHDLTHLHYYSRLHAFYYRVVLKPLFRRAAAIVCVSEYSKRELLGWADLEEERVHVVPNGCSAIFHPGEPNVTPERYVLYPGNRRGYKNLRRLFSAYASSRLPGEGVRLLLTGEPDETLYAHARELGCSHLLGFSGTLDDHSLSEVYRRALAVAFVSLYEGFGLPVVEAMASGVPVLTSTTSALPEVAGDAAVLVDPLDVDAIRVGLETLVFDDAVRARCRDKGLRRARRFSWDRAATSTWDIVRQVARDGRSS